MYIFEIRYREYSGASPKTTEVEAHDIENARKMVKESVGYDCIIESSKRISDSTG